MSWLNFVDTGPPPEKMTPLALDTRTGQSVGPDDRQSFIAHATPKRKSIRAGITPMIRQRPGRSLTNEFGSWLTAPSPRKTSKMALMRRSRLNGAQLVIVRVITR